MLAEFGTKAELTEFMGAPPRCLPAWPGTDLCVWVPRRGAPGPRALSAEVKTSARVRLICTTPAEQAPPSTISCTAHPMRSTRDVWGAEAGDRTPDGGRLSYRGAVARRALLRRKANEQIAAARTLVALSRLVGDLPERCVPTGEGAQLCGWRANSRTHGHGVLMASIAAGRGQKVVMRCELPVRGDAERDPGSCRVAVGAGLGPR